MWNMDMFRLYGLPIIKTAGHVRVFPVEDSTPTAVICKGVYEGCLYQHVQRYSWRSHIINGLMFDISAQHEPPVIC